MSLSREFQATLAKKSDEGLFDMFEHAHEYEAEALDAAQEEVRRRGLSVERAAIKRACALQRAAERPPPSDSTYRVNGIGTTFIGKRNFWDDGTFITTVWFTLVFIPLVPIKSLRISRISWGRFVVMERLPLNLRQVTFTYLFAVFCFSWFAAAVSFTESALHAGYPNLSGSLWIAAIAVPPAVPFILRYRAKKKNA